MARAPQFSARGYAPSDLAAGYRPRPGTTDEMVGPDGMVRPAWRTFVDFIDGLGRRHATEHFARADQYLRDAGVYYRVYGDGGSERVWPLAHVPLLIEAEEWRQIASGLTERAALLEHVVADIYGDATLVADGLIPPQLIAGSPEFLRPMVGVMPASGHFLHFVAFELGRGPDGRWWVLGDRTQAPSGAGFALENRVATARALPDLIASMNAERLAGFFRDLRDALLALAQQPDGVAILTPGQHNDTYFEHAYIARYLGLLLLEGADLDIVDGRAMVRTVDGPKPVSVLWRRLDSAFLDPLELKAESRIGIPGLMEAIRTGATTVVNAVGSGVLETRALLAFLPRVAERLNGAALKLPHIATWWCGGEVERRFVLDRLDRLMIGPAFSTATAFEDTDRTVAGAGLDAAARTALRARIEADGAAHVGQESVTLSTMPFYTEGRLEPRPVTLRAFALRTRDGWTIMPGGFARVGTSPDTSAIAMQSGGRAADVWILSSDPVPPVSLMSGEGDIARVAAALPSRAADNLYWLGRYVERSEGQIRVLRAYHARRAEAADPKNELIPILQRKLKDMGIDHRQPVPETLTRSIDNAVAVAGRIRDRFSPDGWLAIIDLSKTARRFAGQVKPGDDAARAMTVLLRKLAGFAGLAHENMYRGTGWRFLELGRRIERAMEMCRLIAGLAPPDAPAGALDLLLDIGDSVMTHRRLYRMNSGRLAAIELLALDAMNPRSILSQLTEIKAEVELLPGADGGKAHHPAMREALRLHTELAIAEAAELTPVRLGQIARALAGLSDLIDAAYFR